MIFLLLLLLTLLCSVAGLSLPPLSSSPATVLLDNPIPTADVSNISSFGPVRVNTTLVLDSATVYPGLPALTQNVTVAGNATYDAAIKELIVELDNGWVVTANLSDAKSNDTQWQVPITDYVVTQPSGEPLSPASTINAAELLASLGLNASDPQWGGVPSFQEQDVNVSVVVTDTGTVPPTVTVQTAKANVTYDNTTGELVLDFGNGVNTTVNVSTLSDDGIIFLDGALSFLSANLTVADILEAIQTGNTSTITSAPLSLPRYPVEIVWPWGPVQPSPEPPRPDGLSTGQMWMHWIMSGSVETFDPGTQQGMRRHVASFLGQPSWILTIVSVRPGSIILTARLDGYTAGDELAAINILKTSCAEMAPAYGIQCHTFRVTPAGEDVEYVDEAEGLALGVITGIVGLIFLVYIIVGCAFVLLRRQKRLMDPEDTVHERFLTHEMTVAGIPIEIMELDGGKGGEVDGPKHSRIPTQGEPASPLKLGGVSPTKLRTSPETSRVNSKRDLRVAPSFDESWAPGGKTRAFDPSGASSSSHLVRSPLRPPPLDPTGASSSNTFAGAITELERLKPPLAADLPGFILEALSGPAKAAPGPSGAASPLRGMADPVKPLSPQLSPISPTGPGLSHPASPKSPPMYGSPVVGVPFSPKSPETGILHPKSL